MTQRNHCRNLFCILLVLFFVAGVFVNINGVRTVSWVASDDQRQIQCEYGTDSGGVIVTDRLLAAQTLEKTESYYSARAVYRMNETLEETVQRIALGLMALAVVLLLVVFALENWISLEERQIHIFEVIRFIHRTDGKKKSCFENQQTIKTGGQVNGSWYKV